MGTGGEIDSEVDGGIERGNSRQSGVEDPYWNMTIEEALESF